MWIFLFAGLQRYFLMKRTLPYILLYPLSLVYGGVTAIRNFFFDKNIFKSTRFDIPVISIGNLAVGGTGKTPHTEYLISLLQKNHKIAVLSRGYKRQTKGFIFTDSLATTEDVGDEPFQIYSKFPDIVVAVDEKRVHGIQELLKLCPDLDIILLDDAFQHRHVNAGFSILLTDYSNLYMQDFLLPSGRLRESKKGAARADVIIVTKCPKDISIQEMQNIAKQIKPLEHQSVFFSIFEYDGLIPVFNSQDTEASTDNILVVSGIVSPQPMIDYLKKSYKNIQHLSFPDHHDFTEKDILNIYKKYNEPNIGNKIIVVTEKDAARLISNDYYPEELKPKTYALPIRVKILNNEEKLFTEKINNYVTKNSRNS